MQRQREQVATGSWLKPVRTHLGRRGKSSEGTTITIMLDPRSVFRWHLVLIGLMGLLFATVVVGDVNGHHHVFGLSRVFRLSEEANVPTTFSFLALEAAALAALVIRNSAYIDAHERHRWTIFAVVFVFLGVDELWLLHELLSPIGDAMRLPDAFHYFGVFPYLLVAAVLGCYMLPFWLRQSRPVMICLALGGIGYVLAAIGMEVPGNLLTVAGTKPTDPVMAFCYAVEELGEMVAVALFLRAFLTRLGELPSGGAVGLLVRGPAMQD